MSTSTSHVTDYNVEFYIGNENPKPRGKKPFLTIGKGNQIIKYTKYVIRMDLSKGTHRLQDMSQLLFLYHNKLCWLFQDFLLMSIKRLDYNHVIENLMLLSICLVCFRLI